MRRILSSARCAPKRVFGARSVARAFPRFSEAQRFVSVSYTPRAARRHRRQPYPLGVRLGSRRGARARAAPPAWRRSSRPGPRSRSRAARSALADSHPGVIYATAGVHPHHARECAPRTITDLRKLRSTALRRDRRMRAGLQPQLLAPSGSGKVVRGPARARHPIGQAAFPAFARCPSALCRNTEELLSKKSCGALLHRGG